MIDIEKTKNLIRKLLALSKSDNENEAVAAMKKAHELFDGYGLEEADLSFTNTGVKTVIGYCHWRFVLARDVSWLYRCYHYKDKNLKSYIFTGRPFDVFMAAEMYEYLEKTVERAAKKNVRKNARAAFRDSFKLGMAQRIGKRLRESGVSWSNAEDRDTAIEEIKTYVSKTVGLRDAARKKSKINYDAWARGFDRGEKVSLARQAKYAAPARLAASEKQGELFR